MRLNYILNRKNLIVHLEGELDHHNSLSLKKELDAELAKDIAKNIIFSFRKVSFMDSSGLGVILGRYNKISEKGGKIIACEVNPHLYKLFSLSGLLEIIHVVDNEEEALNCL